MKFKFIAGVLVCCVVFTFNGVIVTHQGSKEVPTIGKINTMDLQPTRVHIKNTTVSRGARSERKIKLVKVIATAYCSCEKCCGKSDGITASGKAASWGTMAVPKDIPFGASIYLDGWGTFTAWDRGGAIKRLDDYTIKIDIWFPSHKEALNFGVQEFNTKIIYPEEVSYETGQN